MKIQLIRNATMKITYAGKTLLTDPMLSPKDSIRSFAGIAKNPTVDLPFNIEKILNGIDGIFISHTHPDHYDDTAAQVLPKGIPVFIQPCDQKVLKDHGFLNLHPVIDTEIWDQIQIIRTTGNHGSGEILKRMGNVSGFILKAKNEPTVYWVGDSILYQDVENMISQHHPDIIITHSGGAKIPGFDPIIMDGKQTLELLQKYPLVRVIAIHMESLDHCMETRESLKILAQEMDLDSRITIPLDGQTIEC